MGGELILISLYSVYSRVPYQFRAMLCINPGRGWAIHYDFGNENPTVQSKKLHILIFLSASCFLKHH